MLQIISLIYITLLQDEACNLLIILIITNVCICIYFVYIYICYPASHVTIPQRGRNTGQIMAPRTLFIPIDPSKEQNQAHGKSVKIIKPYVSIYSPIY